VLAAEALIPKASWSAWASGSMDSSSEIVAFARSIRVHPAGVAGRLRHETGDNRKLGRLLGSGCVRHVFATAGS
jgi:HTH-type transcriptional regulator / antitoxin HigA